jgi:hypothetical protein
VIDRPATPRPALREPGDRLGHAIGAHLRVASEDLPPDVTERLRFAREQALRRVRDQRVARVRQRRVGAWLQRWGWQLASALPLVMLVSGFWLIDTLHQEQQIATAADIDSALLADELPPDAYSDAGFAEFLHQDEVL